MSQDTDDLALAWLEPANGTGTPAKLPLATANSTFGRVPGNTHVLADKTVSRQHAKIFVRDGRHWIADQNSTAGTFVNGQKVTLQTLTDGDEVRLGTTLLRYRLPGSSASAPPAAAPPAAAPAAAPKPPPAVPAPLCDPATGAFELELPDASPPPRRPSPPVGTPPPRSGLTAAGEDPFAAPDEGAAPAAREMPAIELRGATARNFGGRPAGSPAGAPVAAASARSATTHLPPPLPVPPKRTGAFAFMGDDLNQRGGLARLMAWVAAVAAAATLCWLAMRLFDAVPRDADAVDEAEEAPSGPLRPQLPPQR